MDDGVIVEHKAQERSTYVVGVILKQAKVYFALRIIFADLDCSDTLSAKRLALTVADSYPLLYSQLALI